MKLEIRNARNFKLLDSKNIRNKRAYYKTCRKLTKIVEKHDKINKFDNEFLIRVRKHSYLVKSNDYGFVVGLK